MNKFWCVTGDLTEVQRYINVPMRWCEQYPSRERREFWVDRRDGVQGEMKFVVHGRVMPARRGHRVWVLLLDEMVVGLGNLHTGERVNYLRDDSPLLLRRCDVLATLGILAAGAAMAMIWNGHSLLLTVPVGLLYIPLRVTGRWLWWGWLRSRVDRMLWSVPEAAPVARPRLRRVK